MQEIEGDIHVGIHVRQERGFLLIGLPKPVPGATQASEDPRIAVGVTHLRSGHADRLASSGRQSHAAKNPGSRREQWVECHGFSTQPGKQLRYHSWGHPADPDWPAQVDGAAETRSYQGDAAGSRHSRHSRPKRPEACRRLSDDVRRPLRVLQDAHGHLCADPPRGNQVHLDVVGGPVQGHPRRLVPHTRLAGGVGGVAGARTLSHYRACDLGAAGAEIDALVAALPTPCCRCRGTECRGGAQAWSAATANAVTLRLWRLNSTPIRWMGAPRWRYLAA